MGCWKQHARHFEAVVVVGGARGIPRARSAIHGHFRPVRRAGFPDPKAFTSPVQKSWIFDLVDR